MCLGSRHDSMYIIADTDKSIDVGNVNKLRTYITLNKIFILQHMFILPQIELNREMS